MKTIGIIGGGQLGMFLAIAAYQMGYETLVYDCKDDCCAKNVATKFFLGSFSDEQRLREFCQSCDVITYEFENIDSDLLARLSKIYPLVQKAHPLILSSSRFNERIMAQKLNIPQPSWQLVSNENDLSKLTLAYPYLLKSDTLGYDGKGQFLINKKDDLKKVSFDKVSYLAENKIAFDYEMSVIGVRSITEEFITYEPFYNIHYHGILNITLINQDIEQSIVLQAKNIVKKIMMEHNIYGLLCCEFFVKGKELFFNEIACRPHNSGHITMDTHYTSQYENHIRALLGLKLGNPDIKTGGYLVNVLGQDVEKTKEFIKENGFDCKYYDYHKEAKYNRKVGHLVVFNDKYLTDFKKNWKKE